jgi:hypothetical protein
MLIQNLFCKDLNSRLPREFFCRKFAPPAARNGFACTLSHFHRESSSYGLKIAFSGCFWVPLGIEHDKTFPYPARTNLWNMGIESGVLSLMRSPPILSRFKFPPQGDLKWKPPAGMILQNTDFGACFYPPS